MNAVFSITFMVNNMRVFRSGNFPLKGRKPEVVVLEWIKDMNRKEFYVSQILKVVYNGNIDITEEVRKLY